MTGVQKADTCLEGPAIGAHRSQFLVSSIRHPCPPGPPPPAPNLLPNGGLHIYELPYSIVHNLCPIDCGGAASVHCCISFWTDCLIDWTVPGWCVQLTSTVQQLRAPLCTRGPQNAWASLSLRVRDV